MDFNESRIANVIVKTWCRVTCLVLYKQSNEISDSKNDSDSTILYYLIAFVSFHTTGWFLIACNWESTLPKPTCFHTEKILFSHNYLISVELAI